jgi:hypothetical protein
VNGSARYPRKAFYLAITIPMIVVYVLIFLLLWRIGVGFALLYAACFAAVAVAQSYVCVYWKCPYVGRFAPCVGGFCLPSSRIALLMGKAGRSQNIYSVAVNGAFAAFLAVTVFPLYFLYLQGVGFLLGYLGLVTVYAVLFLGYVCPVCATRTVCPGGKTSTAVRGMFRRT